MSGSKNGFVKTTLVGGRVGTTEKNPMRYTPAHRTPDGRLVSARLEIPVFVNEYGSKEPDVYRVVAWGGRADMFAKSLSKGKEMNFYLTSKSYFRKIYNNQNQVVMQPDGVTPIMVRQLSFTIRDFTWGSDSNAQVDAEIAAGIRKPGWDTPGTPAHTEWIAKLDARKNMFYQGADSFGYAIVKQPPAGCTVLLGDQSALARRNAGEGVQTQTLVQQVAQTLDPLTGFPVMAPVPAQAAAANAV